MPLRESGECTGCQPCASIKNHGWETPPQHVHRYHGGALVSTEDKNVASSFDSPGDAADGGDAAKSHERFEHGRVVLFWLGPQPGTAPLGLPAKQRHAKDTKDKRGHWNAKDSHTRSQKNVR